jgi:dihydrolipoamide dehydrogenase
MRMRLSYGAFMYDLIILGGGPAGYTAAERAGAAGLSVVLMEQGAIGGVCLNEGCIPSKTLLHGSKLYTQSQEYGVNAANASFDLAAVIARKEKIIGAMQKGIAFSLKKNGVTVESGAGVICDRENGAFKVSLGEKNIEGSRLLVCTGSEAVRLPIPGADRPFVFTNREILSIDRIPKRLAIVGGGAIGLEFATFFVEAGSAVTVIELLPAIGGAIDVEIGQALRRELEKKGIAFKLDSRVTSINDHTVTFETGGQSETIDVDVALMSVGRRPKVKSIGLEAIGVAIEKGAIATDERGRTNVPGVWAAGDVNGVSMLAHTAYREAQACVNDMRGIDDAVNYDALPWVIYTHPEVAGVGLTDTEAAKRGMNVATAKLPLSYNGRFMAENEGTRGLCKVVIDRQSRVLLGVHIIGGPCSEMIFGAAMMVEKKMTAGDIEKCVFPHPTVSEIIGDTVRQVV